MSIKFKTTGYDEFIDFIKFYAIICVIFGHTFPLLDKIGYGIWAGMQVPLFVLVQSFHYLKKEKTKINIRKILGRIVVPFLIAEVLTFTIAMFVKAKAQLHFSMILFIKEATVQDRIILIYIYKSLFYCQPSQFC